MSSKVHEAISEALVRGYQFDPDAYNLVKSLEKETDVLALVRQVIGLKEKGSMVDVVIAVGDVKAAVPHLFEDRKVVDMEQVLESLKPQIVIVRDPGSNLKPSEGVVGFGGLFESRYRKLMKIIGERRDSGSIRRVSDLQKVGKDGVKVAGLILEKKTRRNSMELTIEDESGRIDVLILNEGIRKVASELCLDQMVIAEVVLGRSGKTIARSLSPPDIPDHKANLSKEKVYAVLTSDLHVGSRFFLRHSFEEFVLWLNGKRSDQDVVSRVRYVVICGDAVDGVGVYPDQDKELEETDARHQYEILAELLSQVPKNMEVILVPGDHDPVRRALPQPSIPKIYSKPLQELGNVRLLGNPSVVRLHGVEMVLYHGRSLVDVVTTTPGLTFSRPAAAMKVLLRARHLAPAYGARTPIAPEVEDSLVIEDVPDVLHCGHVHTLEAEYYRGTLMVNSGAWQAQTSFQANLGIQPTPAIVPILDLSNLEVFTKSFVEEPRASSL